MSLSVEELTKILLRRRILLGVTGSIAAHKAVDVVRLLKKSQAEVRVILTENASRFVTPLTLETLSENRVGSSLWGSSELGTHHIDWARWGEVFVIAPATANGIAKLAHGLADDLLTTEALAFQGPVMIFPAMNPAMWLNPATISNVETLRSRRVQVLEPESGLMACGEEGPGRFWEPQAVVEAIGKSFLPKWNGKTAVVTWGGRERIWILFDTSPIDRAEKWGVLWHLH